MGAGLDMDMDMDIDMDMDMDIDIDIDTDTTCSSRSWLIAAVAPVYLNLYPRELCSHPVCQPASLHSIVSIHHPHSHLDGLAFNPVPASPVASQNCGLCKRESGGFQLESRPRAEKGRPESPAIYPQHMITSWLLPPGLSTGRPPLLQWHPRTHGQSNLRSAALRCSTTASHFC